MREHVTAFADLWCPFAYVGLSAAIGIRDELAPDAVVAMKAWPLELVNDAPLDPATVAHHIEALRTQVAPHLFGGVAMANFPTSTLDALALVAHAGKDDPKQGESLAMALRTMLFEEGLDISNVEILGEAARLHDVDPDHLADHALVVEQWQEGIALGVVGSPHFFSRHGDLFCPLLDIERKGTELDVTSDAERLEGFLRASWPV